MAMAIRVATLTSPDGNSMVFSNIEDSTDDHQAWLTDLSGFYGGVGVSESGSQRKLGHGFFAMPSLRTGRALTLSGTITFKNEQLRTLADRFISGQLWDGGLGTLTVQTDEQVLSCKVKLDGEIKHAYHGVSAIQVQIPLSAPDPFLYAAPRLYQVFPAGAGEGLVFPLFTTKAAPGSKQNLVGTLSAYAQKFTASVFDSPQPPGGSEWSSFRYSTVESGDLLSVVVEPGATYKITVLTRASAEGTKATVRTHLWGNDATTQFAFVTSGGDSSPEAITAGSWGEHSIYRTAGLNHSRLIFTVSSFAGGLVDGVTQDFLFYVEKTGSPVLDWGAGAPAGGAFANAGNADAHPTYTVHGSWPAGFRITTGSKVIEYPSPVVPGHPAIIDHKTGSVTVAGVDQTYRLTRRDWVAVPAGEAIQPHITALAPSNGWADITISDTYI